MVWEAVDPTTATQNNDLREWFRKKVDHRH